MKISELQLRQGSVEVEGEIKEIGEVRTIDKFDRQIRVANAILADDSGEIKLVLWNEDIEKYKQGDKVKVTNGYVNEFQGEKQLTAGKFGKIEKLGEESGEGIIEENKDGNKEETEEKVEEESKDEVKEINEENKEE